MEFSSRTDTEAEQQQLQQPGFKSFVAYFFPTGGPYTPLRLLSNFDIMRS